MKDPEWIPITPESSCPKGRFFTCDEYGLVFVGDTARDFWDSMKYWFPMPKFPYPRQGFVSPEAFQAILKTITEVRNERRMKDG
jgi:hypothetical protein